MFAVCNFHKMEAINRIKGMPTVRELRTVHRRIAFTSRGGHPDPLITDGGAIR